MELPKLLFELEQVIIKCWINKINNLLLGHWPEINTGNKKQQNENDAQLHMLYLII